MPRTLAVSATKTCFRCLAASRQYVAPITIFTPRCHFSCSSMECSSQSTSNVDNGASWKEKGDTLSGEAQTLNSQAEAKDGEQKELGAMSRRLAEATEDAVLTGGRAGRKAVEEAGFSEELKAKLLERVEAAKFKSENASAFAEAELSSNAGRGTRYIASAEAWTGVENTEDTVLRMLHDKHKPLAPGSRGPGNGGPGSVVDLRIKREPRRTSGQRLANARDKTSIYAITKDSQMTDQERESMRKEFKDRYSPAARAMPNSITGLAALANERIEDAIARGQFKNIPRGKAIVRDARADNPFIDTTEYIMNKMIQRQDIVPPWIEKQQELVKAANIFRGRLRNDWKRHAARTISSRGGSLQEQVRLANLYAEAEKKHNPKMRAIEQIAVPANITEDPVMLNIVQEAPTQSGEAAPLPVVEVSVESQSGKITIPFTSEDLIMTPASSPEISQESTSAPTSQPLPAPLRDAAWEATELSYLSLAVSNLNSITRSYNLMAPDLAKKPYYNLEREMRSCYADVAPQVAEEIVDRARKPSKVLVEKIGHRPGSVLEKFGGENAFVYDERKKPYGFREFWKDLRGKGDDGA